MLSVTSKWALWRGLHHHNWVINSKFPIITTHNEVIYKKIQQASELHGNSGKKEEEFAERPHVN